jgi:hypothetical protein
MDTIKLIWPHSTLSYIWNKTLFFFCEFEPCSSWLLFHTHTEQSLIIHHMLVTSTSSRPVSEQAVAPEQTRTEVSSYNPQLATWRSSSQTCTMSSSPSTRRLSTRPHTFLLVTNLCQHNVCGYHQDGLFHQWQSRVHLSAGVSYMSPFFCTPVLNVVSALSTSRISLSP